MLTGAPGGAMASWMAYPAGAAAPVMHEALVSSSGAAGSAHAPADGWVAVAADSRGDQVLRQLRDPLAVGPQALAARASNTGAADVAPLAAMGFPWTAGLAGAGDGRALAALGYLPGGLLAAVWRP
jgi:hypothetical protein